MQSSIAASEILEQVARLHCPSGKGLPITDKNLFFVRPIVMSAASMAGKKLQIAATKREIIDVRCVRGAGFVKSVVMIFIVLSKHLMLFEAFGSDSSLTLLARDPCDI